MPSRRIRSSGSSRSHWGGTYNRELKRLMLGHAFRFVGSVIFLVDPANLRSQRAVEKIGGVRSGSRQDGSGRPSNTHHGWNHDSQFVIRVPDHWNGGLVITGAPGVRTQYANDFIVSDWVLAQGVRVRLDRQGQQRRQVLSGRP